MPHTEFFHEVKTITLFDPLASFLGAIRNGLVQYTYLDAVKLAGHSCPTVAGAYLMTAKALEQLYPGETPQRGAIQVFFHDDIAKGVTGVMANITSLVTGATQDSGFKGIGGQFDRRNLLFFNAQINGNIRFGRTDNASTIDVRYHPERVPASPIMKDLLQKVAANVASEEEKKEFAVLWQHRVKKILIDHADDPEMIEIVS